MEQYPRRMLMTPSLVRPLVVLERTPSATGMFFDERPDLFINPLSE